MIQKDITVYSITGGRPLVLQRNRHGKWWVATRGVLYGPAQTSEHALQALADYTDLHNLSSHNRYKKGGGASVLINPGSEAGE